MPPDRAWRPTAGASRAERAAEQDTAAGGTANRQIPLEDGSTATASISLRLLPKSRRIYAYLRWSDSGRTRERYVCEATAQTRSENLALAWQAARGQGLVPRLETPTTSWASTTGIRNIMRANRARDTGPELALRRAVHSLGLRYRVGGRPIPTLRRTADVIFPGAKVAVFVDGCFWHGCPEHHRPASRNGEFWRAKIDGNKARDSETDAALADQGWSVVRVWEHEDPSEAAGRLAAVVKSARGPTTRSRRRPTGPDP